MAGIIKRNFVAPSADAKAPWQMSAKELCAYSLGDHEPMGWRKAYFAELYRRIAALGTGAPACAPFLEALSTKMAYRDRMAFVYNEDAWMRYGGNQHAIAMPGNRDSNNNTKALLLGILSRYENLPPEGVSKDDFLTEYVAGRGCSYVVAANAIMVEFAGRPKEFEEKFGFPLYRMEGGQPLFHFEALTVDYYCSAYFIPQEEIRSGRVEHGPGADGILNTMDDIVKVKQPDGTWWAYASPSSDGVPGALGDGQNAMELSANLEKYLAGKGIPATVSGKFVDLAEGGRVDEEGLESLREALADGKSVVLRISPTRMRGASGALATFSDNVHDVTVTAVDRAGNLTVSSWGARYAILAADFAQYSSTTAGHYPDSGGNPVMDTCSIGYQTIRFR
ncbi:MAG: hypothetical protein LBR44_05535 [Clostridiales Family XIII bacterium]|jgi:hypothetical protein|nr:hypothetical protein [Clostridiales Family XIII bacterium]